MTSFRPPPFRTVGFLAILARAATAPAARAQQPAGDWRTIAAPREGLIEFEEAIFDEEQWQRVERQFAEARRLEKILRTGGFLPDDDMADAGNARRNEPISEPERPRC